MKPWHRVCILGCPELAAGKSPAGMGSSPGCGLSHARAGPGAPWLLETPGSGSVNTGWKEQKLQSH